VELGVWKLENPVIPASGTFGFGHEFAQWFDLNILGSISLKGTTLEPRFGNPTPRVAECSSGMLNSIGLQNPGVEAVINQELPKLFRCFNKKVIANVAGNSIEEYLKVASMFDKVPQVAVLEVNLSCPNVKIGGMSFGVSVDSVRNICFALKKIVNKPIFVKLSPNVTNISDIAVAAEDSGADGLVLINCLLGCAINPISGKFVVSTKFAGFSGPAIKPVALRMVAEVYSKVKIPIIGVGGITCADDVIEFLSAGASAVEVGTQNLVDPRACFNIIKEIPNKMKNYGIKTLRSIIGRSHS
jgi:dihydroorotate dehydrogenase (NAD+) catalytic subunit